MKRKLPICIAGAGIGGLTAAYALGRLGFEVKVCEKAEALRPIGAGITLQMNAMGALRNIGIGKSVAERGNAINRVTARTEAGRTRTCVDLTPLAKQLGGTSVCIHRAELQRTLMKTIDRRSVALSCAVESFNEGKGGKSVTVRIENGDEFEAAALVGADGIHSCVQKSLSENQELNASQYRSWRGIGKRPDSLACDEGHGWWGRGKAFGCFPLPGDDLYWYATESKSHADAPDNSPANYLQSQFHGWDDTIHEIIGATAAESVSLAPLTQRRPQPAWGRGHTTLLGDAAHPMLPSMGQGGGQAIEDAVVLANCLRESTLGKPISACLRDYERKRYERTDRIVCLSDRMTRIAHGERLLDRVTRGLLPFAPNALRRRQLWWLYKFGYTGGEQLAVGAQRSVASF